MKMLIVSENPLGNYFYNYFKDKFDVSFIENINIILFKRHKLIKYIKNFNPDFIINNYELNDIEKCEISESKAMKYNSISALNIAYACNNLSIPLVFISSNHVYGGKKNSPYYETDKCNPINRYGKSKLAAERLIKTLSEKYFIFRPGWIFGENNDLISKIINNKHSSIFMCSTEIGSPTYVLDLCKIIEKAISSDFYGIYNCANPEPIKKSLWIKFIMDNLNCERKIVEIPSNYISNTAPRPEYSALNTYLLKNCFELSFPNWKDRTLESIQLTNHKI